MLQAAIALIVKGGADAHMPDRSAARHTPLEAAVVSGYRALSHRLVILVDNRQKAEEKRHALLESFAVASREVQCVVFTFASSVQRTPDQSRAVPHVHGGGEHPFSMPWSSGRKP